MYDLDAGLCEIAVELRLHEYFTTFKNCPQYVLCLRELVLLFKVMALIPLRMVWKHLWCSMFITFASFFHSWYLACSFYIYIITTSIQASLHLKTWNGKGTGWCGRKRGHWDSWNLSITKMSKEGIAWRGCKVKEGSRNQLFFSSPHHFCWA